MWARYSSWSWSWGQTGSNEIAATSRQDQIINMGFTLILIGL